MFDKHIISIQVSSELELRFKLLLVVMLIMSSVYSSFVHTKLHTVNMVFKTVQ